MSKDINYHKKTNVIQKCYTAFLFDCFEMEVFVRDVYNVYTNKRCTTRTR